MRRTRVKGVPLSIDLIEPRPYVLISPVTVPGGTTTTANITLIAPAPAGGLPLSLFSKLRLTAQIQPTVTVPAGARTVSVPVTTSIGFPNSTTSAQISAGAGDGIVATGVNVVTGAVAPVLAISAPVLNPSTVVGGATVQGSVSLNGPAPTGGALITLQSTNAAVATTPASVTIPTGATTASFSVATTAVTAPTRSNIAAGFNGGFIATTLNVNPASVAPPPVTNPAPSPAAAPSLVTPAADARFTPGATVAFDWSDVSGAASYAIQVSNTDKFTSFAVNQTVASSAFSNAALPTSTLFWRVRANSAAGAGAWSAVRRLEIK